MTLHILDGKMNPDPMTVDGTKDLEAMFWALNPEKVSRKASDDDYLPSPSPIIFSIL